MPVEVTSAGTLITGDSIQVVRLMTIRRGLKLEIETGMKLSRGVNLLNVLRHDGVIPDNCRTKRKAYAILDKLLSEIDGIDSVPLRS